MKYIGEVCPERKRQIYDVSFFYICYVFYICFSSIFYRAEESQMYMAFRDELRVLHEPERRVCSVSFVFYDNHVSDSTGYPQVAGEKQKSEGCRGSLHSAESGNFVFV